MITCNCSAFIERDGDRAEVTKIVEKIVALARRRGHTQETLESAVGLAKNRISKWRTQGEPTARQLYAIAQALGVSILYFFDDSLTRTPERA